MSDSQSQVTALLAAWQGGSRPFLPWTAEDSADWEEFRTRCLKPVFESKGPPTSDFSSAWSVVYEISLDEVPASRGVRRLLGR